MLLQKSDATVRVATMVPAMYQYTQLLVEFKHSGVLVHGCMVLLLAVPYVEPCCPCDSLHEYSNCELNLHAY